MHTPARAPARDAGRPTRGPDLRRVPRSAPNAHPRKQAAGIFRLRRRWHRTATQPLRPHPPIEIMDADSTSTLEPTPRETPEGRRTERERINANKLSKRLIRETARAI